MELLAKVTAAKIVRMLRYSSHWTFRATILLLQTYADTGFSAERTNFSSRGLSTEEAMTRSAKATTGAANFVAMWHRALQPFNH